MWSTIAENLTYSLWLHLPFALAVWALRLVRLSGFVGGLILGQLIILGAGWRGWSIFVAFVVLGSLVTKLGYRVKESRGLAQEDGGRRGARHALANTAWAAVLALAFPVVSALSPALAPALSLAFIGAFAAALFDTASSEIGQLYGRSPVLITTLRRVAPGTPGAVSIQGTLGGLTLAALLGTLAYAVGSAPAAVLWIAPLAGLLGGCGESLLGALLPPGRLSNETENFLNTVIGSLAAFALAWL